MTDADRLLRPVLRRAFGVAVATDQRIQAIIIAFCFGALLEALAGFGTPVAVTAVMLIAVGISSRSRRPGRVGRQHRAGRLRCDRASPITTLAQDHRTRRRTMLGADGRPADPDPGRVRAADPGAAWSTAAAASGRPGSRPSLAVSAFAVAQFACLELFLLPGRRHHRGAGRSSRRRAAAARLAAVEIITAERSFSRRSRRLEPAVPPRNRNDRRGTGAEHPGRHRQWCEPDAVPSPRSEALMAFAPYLIVVALFAVTSFGPCLHFLEGAGLEVRLARPGRP